MILLSSIGLLVSGTLADDARHSRTAGEDYQGKLSEIQRLEEGLKRGQADREFILSVVRVGIDYPEGLEGELGSLDRLVPPAAIPILIESLGDSSPRIRARAAQILGRIGPSSIEAVPQLVQMF